jgi:hypothetical protein
MYCDSLLLKYNMIAKETAIDNSTLSTVTDNLMRWPQFGIAN